MTTTPVYKRPTGTIATAVGERNRTRWSRYMRKRLFDLVRPIEFMAAEESEPPRVYRRVKL